MNVVPVAVFAYRRVDALKATLESLRTCDDYRDRPVIVFSDGAKNGSDALDVSAVREYLRSLDWVNLEVYHSPSNMGLRQAVHAGVSDVLKRWESCIVLEDDLILDHVALSFFDKALNTYADCTNVFSVCGYMYNVPRLASYQSVLFLPFASSWGWGTWRRAWDGFSVDAADYKALWRSRAFRRFLRAPSVIAAEGMLDLQLNRGLDSWAILWNAHLVRHGALAVFPPRRTLVNGGIASGGATHSSRYNPYNRWYAEMERGSPRLKALDGLTFHKRPEVDFLALDWIAGSRHTHLARMSSHLGYLRRRLARSLRR